MQFQPKDLGGSKNMAGSGGARYGNTWILRASPHPEGEIERVRAIIAPEEMLLNGMLEANHSRLITSGIVEKIIALEAERYRRGREEHGRNYGGPMPTVADEELVASVCQLSLREPEGTVPVQVKLTRRVGTITTISHRLIRGEYQELLPVNPFTEEESAMVASMIDELIETKNSGKLPHLSSNLDRLLIACPSFVAYAHAYGRTSELDGMHLGPEAEL